MTAALVELDRPFAAELLVAIRLYRRWARDQRIAPSPGFDDLEAALRRASQHDRSRQEPTTVADRPDPGDLLGVERLLLGYDEAAHALGISRRTLERLVECGELVAVDVGERAKRINREDLEAFAARHRGARPARPTAPPATVPPGVRFKQGA